MIGAWEVVEAAFQSLQPVVVLDHLGHVPACFRDLRPANFGAGGIFSAGPR